MKEFPELSADGGDAAWLAAAVFFALALRAVFFSALTGFDEFAYARIAGDIADGSFRFRDASGYYGFRYLVTFPAALFHKLAGLTPFSAAAWPLVCSLGNTLLAYFLGRELFDRRAGLLAAFFQASLPISVIYGTMLYPEEILVFWTGLSALFFLKGSKISGPWGGARLLALSGLFAGLGWHTRLNSAVMLLVYAAWALRSGPRPAYLALAAGFLCALIPDWAAGAALAGDPLFSLRSQLAKLAADFSIAPRGHFIYLRGLLGLDLYGLASSGFYFYFFAAAAAAAAYKKELGRLGLPLAWFGIVLAYLEFGLSSFSPYQPVHKQLRFLTMCLFPVLLTAADLVSRSKAGYRAAAAGFLLLTSAGAAWKMSAYRAAEAAPLAQAAAYLKERPLSAIYAEGGLGNSIGYYLRERHKEPYYTGPAAGEKFIRPLKAALSGPLPGSCALLELPAVPSGDNNDRLSAAARRLEEEASDRFELPGMGWIYCFK